MTTADAAVPVIPPSLTAEDALSPYPRQSEDVTPFADQPSSTPSPRPQKLETLPPSPPHFLDYVAGLRDLSTAISAFHQCYDDLHNHLDSIKTAISAKLPPQITMPTASFSSPNPNVLELESELQKQHEEQQNGPESELVGLCKTMCSRGVRKYLSTHLSILPMIRDQVPLALRHAPDPPKLVLECLGKFFLQGSKAFSRDSPMIPAREASILILECFLLMLGMDTETTNDKDTLEVTNILKKDGGGVLNIEKAVKEEADNAAMAWRKRMISEGGVAKACQIDARGLLLFVACFGIPASFKVEDIRDLMIPANAKEIASVLQKSNVLMSKISEIVEGMLKKKMKVDAVDIIITFGLEEKFNPHSILVSVLRESKETWKMSRKGGSLATLTEANKKQLVALKSISKCLEGHNIDPAKLLPGWQINDKIATLEKDIFNSDKKAAAQKRKSSETEKLKKAKSQDAKRSRYGASGHVDNRRNVMLDNYSASQAVIYGGPGAGLVPPQHGGAVILQTYAGAPHDAASRQVINPYTWHRDTTALDDQRYSNPSHSQPHSVGVGLTALYRAPVEGFAGNIANNATSLVGGPGLATRGGGSAAAPSDIYQFADYISEREWYPTTVAATAVPPAHQHSSSYLYQV